MWHEIAKQFYEQIYKQLWQREGEGGEEQVEKHSQLRLRASYFRYGKAKLETVNDSHREGGQAQHVKASSHLLRVLYTYSLLFPEKRQMFRFD